MYCSRCGTDIPDEANYCWECGKPQKPDAIPVLPRYETCEIAWDEVKVHRAKTVDLMFWANAVGKDGAYNAGESDVFSQRYFVLGRLYDGPNGHIAECANAHAALVKKLIDEGWESTPDRGAMWYQLRFRRLLSE